VLYSVGKDRLSVENTDVEDYETQTQNALMGECPDAFEYEVKRSGDKDSESLQFIWKRIIEKDHIKVRIGIYFYYFSFYFRIIFSSLFVQC